MSIDAETFLPGNETPEYVCSTLGGLVNYNSDLVNVHSAWRNTRGRGAKVVILDTGVPRHRDISVSGWKSFVRDYDYDLSGHGTAVGSVVAGTGSGGVGILGIAPDCDDWYGAVMNECGVGRIDDIVDGVHWAVDEVGADVINMSLGTPGAVGCDDRLVEACHYAYDHGVTVVAAAGNDASEVNCPALVDTVIAVGAVDRKLRRADFSSYGPEVEFAAGGVDVLMAYRDNGYASMSGTSFSAPVISGIAALLISGHRKVGEEISPDHVRDHLRSLAMDIGQDGRDDYTGWGMPVFRKEEDGTRSGSWRDRVLRVLAEALECLRRRFSVFRTVR